MARVQDPDGGGPVPNRRGRELTDEEREALGAVERATTEADRARVEDS